MAIVARWLFDEASSGTTPTTVADSSGVGSAANLTIAYNGGSWTSIASGKGLRGAAELNNFGPGHKLFTAGSGDAWSITVACNPGDLSPDGYGFAWAWRDTIHLENSGTLEITSAGVLRLHNDNAVGAFQTNASAISLSTYHQITVVFDWLNATAADRLRLYVDGSRITSFASYTAPTSAMDLGGDGTNCNLVFATADDTWDITCFYAEIDDSALSDSAVAALHSALASNNDTVGPDVPILNSRTPVDGATGVARSTTLSLTFNQNVKVGTGDVVITETGVGVFETIDITDGGQVVFSSATVTITLSSLLDWETDYHVEIDSGAILANDDDEPYGGISGTTAWNFTTETQPVPPITPITAAVFSRS